MTSIRILAAVTFSVAAALVTAPVAAGAHAAASAVEIDAARRPATVIPPLAAIAEAIISDPSLNPRREVRRPSTAIPADTGGWADWGIWIVIYLLISALAVFLFGSIARAGAGEQPDPVAARRSRGQNPHKPPRVDEFRPAAPSPSFHAGGIRAR